MDSLRDGNLMRTGSSSCQLTYMPSQNWHPLNKRSIEKCPQNSVWNYSRVSWLIDQTWLAGMPLQITESTVINKLGNSTDFVGGFCFSADTSDRTHMHTYPGTWLQNRLSQQEPRI